MEKLNLRLLLCWVVTLSASGNLYAQQSEDAVVVIVSTEQSINALSLQQIEDLFLGRSSAFPDGSEAIPVDQAEDSELRRQFYQDILGRTTAQIRSHWARQVFTGRGRPPQTANSTDELLQLIRGDARIVSYLKKVTLNADTKVVFE